MGQFLVEIYALPGSLLSGNQQKGDHEALVEDCKTCLHASKGSWCRLFDMPMEMALNTEGPCTFDREGYDAAD